jgi:cell division protein ZapA
MRGSFGEIGEMRLHVMAAITIADDLSEARRRIDLLEKEVGDLKALASAGDERSQIIEARAAEAVQKTAERIERLARGLNPAAAGT